MTKKKVIAVDGPAGAGKSTVSKLIAERLGFTYIDTGAMYRAVALKFHESGASETDDAIKAAARDIDLDLQYIDGKTRVYVDGRDVTSEIRTPEVTRLSSLVAKIGFVRQRLTEIQREMAARGGVIMDGRDIGTHVLPNADVKIFLTASLDERARRRYEEMRARGYDVDRAEIEKDIAARDKQDSERAIAPLMKADDAVLIDSTDMTIDQVVDEIICLTKD